MFDFQPNIVLAEIRSFLFHRLTKRLLLRSPGQFLAKTGNNLTVCNLL